MKREVIINIVGKQGIDEDSDTIEMTSEGVLMRRNNEVYISYDESNFFGLKNVKSTIHLKDEKTIIMQRTGMLENRLEFIQGLRSKCYYSTPQGNIVLDIVTENIECDFNEKEGKIYIDYSIYSDMNLVSKNVVNISVSEVKNNVNRSVKCKRAN